MRKFLRRFFCALLSLVLVAAVSTAIAVPAVIRSRGDLSDYMVSEEFQESIGKANAKRAKNTSARIMSANLLARIEFRYRVKIWTVNDGVKPKIALIFQFVAENAAKNPSNIVEYLQCVVRLFECDVIYNGAQGFVLDAFRCIRRLYQIQHKTGLLDELGRNFATL